MWRAEGLVPSAISESDEEEEMSMRSPESLTDARLIHSMRSSSALNLNVQRCATGDSPQFAGMDENLMHKLGEMLSSCELNLLRSYGNEAL